MKKTLIIIPAYNEDKTISDVLSSLNTAGFANILVVDDGSCDSTKEVVLQTASNIISYEKNIGYSKAIQEGLKWACDQQFDFAITYDADGEFFASDALKIDELLRKNMVKVAIGTRYYFPRASEKIINFFTSHVLGIKDYFCGLKGFNLQIFKSEISRRDCSNNNSQLLSYAIKNKMLIAQTPISLNTNSIRESRFGMSLVSEIKILNSFMRGFI